MKWLKLCVGGMELFRFSSSFGELCPIVHCILEKSVQACMLVSLYSKKARWISDLDCKMWDECFLQIIQTRCASEFKAEKMVFRLSLKCVCVCVCLQLDYIQAEETQLKGLLGAFFYCPVLMLPKEIGYNRNYTISMKIYLQTQQDHMCLPLNKNPCTESFFKLKTEMLHFPVLGKFY